MRRYGVSAVSVLVMVRLITRLDVLLLSLMLTGKILRVTRAAYDQFIFAVFNDSVLGQWQ